MTRIRKQDVLGAVTREPGRTAGQIAQELGASRKAVECHLLRLTSEGAAHNAGSRNGGSVGEVRAMGAWVPGPAPRPKRVASVFDLGSGLG